jgi:hypothetical protein
MRVGRFDEGIFKEQNTSRSNQTVSFDEGNLMGAMIRGPRLPNGTQ